MPTTVPRAPHPHARRVPGAASAAGDAALAADRRHVLLVAAHRAPVHGHRPPWLRWLDGRLQPGQRAF